MEDDYHLQKLLQPPRSCPRCDSDDTKFCYFNNYSLTQPRYFCKGCRRYWTHGGTLRDVPVGGCSHRAKRPRLSAPPPPLPPPPPPPLPFIGGAGPSPFPGCFVGGFYPSFVAGPSIAVPPPPDMGLLQPYPSFIAGSSANPDQ